MLAVCVCVCASEIEWVRGRRDRKTVCVYIEERERDSVSVCAWIHECICGSVCVYVCGCSSDLCVGCAVSSKLTESSPPAPECLTLG